MYARRAKYKVIKNSFAAFTVFSLLASFLTDFELCTDDERSRACRLFKSCMYVPFQPLKIPPVDRPPRTQNATAARSNPAS